MFAKGVREMEDVSQDSPDSRGTMLAGRLLKTVAILVVTSVVIVDASVASDLCKVLKGALHISEGAQEGARRDQGALIVASPLAEAEEVSLSGWFTVIWNDRTRYFLSDDQGLWTELLLEEEMVKPLGGPLAVNRKRVKIVGERVAAPPGAVRVLSLAFDLE